MLIPQVKIFTLKNLVGLSLILSTNYYFLMRKFFFADLEKIIIQTFALFFFSFIFLYLILWIFGFLKKKLKNQKKLNLILICSFFTWLLVQSLKTIFFVSNYITVHCQRERSEESKFLFVYPKGLHLLL